MDIDSDLFLTVGIVLAFLSVPSFVSAFAASRPPRGPVTLLVVGAALILLAIISKPGGYAGGEVTDAVLGVIKRVIQ